MAPDNDLNEQVEVTVEDAAVITVPIDATLSNSGEAADAKAVGDALALKADAASINAITVNGEGPDNQGHIIIDGGDIKMSSSDNTTLTAAITAAAERTGADIPVSGETGAATISEAIGEISGKTAADIPMSASSEVTVAQKIGVMDTALGADTEAIAALQAKAGDTIKLVTGGSETIEQAVKNRVLAVNGELPDATGNVTVLNTLTADNLTSGATQTSAGEWTVRTAGGTASIESGPAWMSSLMGNRTHTGYVAEVLEMTVESDHDNPITATINRATFVSYVDESGTTTLTYTSSWSADPANYGVTVTGTPESGDTITIVYVKEERGTITQSKPEMLVATGYNLFDSTAGYAIGVKYSNDYGFVIRGTYTAVKWAATADATVKTTLTPVDGMFSIPGDGIIFVEGYSTDTMIFMTWSDWVLSTDWPAFEAYSTSVIDMSDLFDPEDENAPFPYGLLRAGDVRDEINFSTGKAISNISRLAYNSTNLAAAEASGLTYEYDEYFIYLERAQPVSTDIELDGEYTVSDHGLEYFTGTAVAPYAVTVYGNNLKNKLERDVLTISAQTLTSGEQAQVQENLGLVPTTATDKTTAGFVADARAIATLDSKLKFYKCQCAVSSANTNQYFYFTLPTGVGSSALAIASIQSQNSSASYTARITATITSGKLRIGIYASSAQTYNVNVFFAEDNGWLTATTG